MDSPFQDPLRFDRRVPPCIIVIFGANGDLTKRKLLPALYRLAYERRIPPNFAVIGNSRTEMTDDDFRGKMRESVEQFLENSPFDEALWNDFARNLFYMAGDITKPEMFAELKKRLDEIDGSHQTEGNVLFYLSTQPSYYATLAENIGHDLKTARELNDRIHSVFREDEVYRIDHYLGKETVQNILAFRFGNGIFEPLWNRRYVDNVQITAAESIGVDHRDGAASGIRS